MLVTYLNKQVKLEGPLNGFDLAKHFGVKKVIAYSFNGKKLDLKSEINEDGVLDFICEGDEVALDILRHSASHLLAQAILNLYPHVLFGFGPSIENGFYYDIDFGEMALSADDFLKIEQEMRRIVKADFPIERKVLTRDEALELFKDNPYKVELIKEIEEPISIYSQGDFVDLCSGPHVPSTRYIKHFKILSLAGAYWRGDSSNKQLTRVYATAFFFKEDLDNHLYLLEEAKKRDHRKLGRELGLFMISEYAPGSPFLLDAGLVIRQELEQYWYDLHRKNGYIFVKTPIMLNKQLWELSGHWNNYKDNMYISKVDNNEVAIKPMNCPGSILVYKNDLHSYNDLPLKMGELGLVHRNEASGALNGLFRVRAFTQDDAHIYCTPEQLKDEIIKLLHLFDEMYSVFDLSYELELSTRPESNYIGDIASWDISEKALADACQAVNKDFKVNPGDGAFYGPKLDYKLKDSLGRVWQCGTIQLDMNLPERFDLTYIDENNEKKRPVMLHRAIYGSLERFMGILIEHYGGDFPLWLAPRQVRVLPVNSKIHYEGSNKLTEALKAAGIRAELDASNEKLGYRMRNAQLDKVKYTVVIGDGELENNAVTYRRFGERAQIKVTLSEFISLLQDEIAHKA